MLITRLFVNDKGIVGEIDYYVEANSIDNIVKILSRKWYILFDIKHANGETKNMEGSYGYIASFYSNISPFDDSNMYETSCWAFTTKVESKRELLDTIFVPLQNELESIKKEKSIIIYEPGKVSTILLTPKLDDMIIDYSNRGG